MSDDFEFSAVQHRVAGRPGGIAGQEPEWIFDFIALHLHEPNNFIRVDIDVHREDEEYDPAEGPRTIDTFSFWDEVSGLRVESWPRWFLSRIVRYAEQTPVPIFPKPRTWPLLPRQQQIYLWPEDEYVLPTREEIQKFARRRSSVPFFQRLDELPIAPEILEELRN